MVPVLDRNCVLSVTSLPSDSLPSPVRTPCTSLLSVGVDEGHNYGLLGMLLTEMVLGRVVDGVLYGVRRYTRGGRFSSDRMEEGGTSTSRGRRIIYGG